MICAPLAPNWLTPKLRTRAKSEEYQGPGRSAAYLSEARAITAGIGAVSSILERGKGLVRLDGLAERLYTPWTDFVVQ